MSYLYQWFMWMPAKWAFISINPEVQPRASDSFTAEKDYECMVCKKTTRNICSGWYGPLCSFTCEREWNWGYQCASVGRKRFIQPLFWKSVFKKYIFGEY